MTRRKRLLTAAAGLLGLALDVGNLVLLGLARVVLTKRVPCRLCRVPTPTGQILNGGCCITCSLTDPEARRAPTPGPICGLCEDGHPVGNSRRPMTPGACPVCGAPADPATAAPPRRSGWQGAVVVTPPVNTKPEPPGRTS